MVMHPLCSTVPSEPSTRRYRSKGTVGPLPRPPRSNSTAPAPPADVERRDRNEIGARTDTISRIDGPRNGEGGVRGSIVDVDLDLGNEIALPLTCRGNDDQARTLPRHGSQGTHGTGRTGLRRGRRDHGCASREQANGQPTKS